MSNEKNTRLREEALRLAQLSSDRGEKAEEVVKRAEEYYKFLSA